MKFLIFVFFAVFAFCHATSSDIEALKKDIHDFEPLLPKISIGVIAAKHFIFDGQFRKAKNFIGSDESNALGLKIMKSRPFHEMVDFLKQKNINLPEVINTLAAKLHFPEYPANFEEEVMAQPRTLTSFIDEVVRALPKDKFATLMRKKVQTSPVFRKFLEIASSPEFNKRAEKILNFQPLRPTFDKFNSKSIDCKHIYEAVKTILSWGR